MIDQDNVEEVRTQDTDVPFSNYASLTRSTEVQALIQAEVDRVNKKFCAGGTDQEVLPARHPAHGRGRGADPTMKLKRKTGWKKSTPANRGDVPVNP